MSSFCAKIDKLVPTVTGECKGPTVVKASWEKDKVRGLALLDFKTYFKVPVGSNEWYWHRDRQMDTWNRKGNLEMDQHTQEQLIFDKGAKATE